MLLRRLSEFELRRFVGRGPHGDAFLASNTVAGCEAVVKRFHGKLPPPRATHELNTLVLRLQAFAHPQVASVQRVIHAEQSLWLARDRAPGKRLDRIAARPLSVSEAIELLQPLVRALDAMHQSELIHGHLSPRNLWRQSGAELIVTDPAAVLIAREMTGAPLPDWSPLIAPELRLPLGGDRPQRATPRADVLSFACLLELMLTGRVRALAATRRGRGQRAAFLEVEKIAPEQRQDHVELPKPVADLLRRAQSPEPNSRPSSMREFWPEFINVSKSKAQWLKGAPAIAAFAAEGRKANAGSAIRFCPHCRRAVKGEVKVCPACKQPLSVARRQPPRKPARPADAKTNLLRGMGETLLQQGQYAEAQMQLERALQRTPGDARSRNALARALVAQGEYETAMKHFRELSQSLDRNAALAGRMGQAITLAIQKRFEDAVYLLERVTQEFPGHAHAHYALGEIYLHMDDHLTNLNHVHSAERHFYVALEVDPRHLGAQRGMEAVGHRRRAGRRLDTIVGQSLMDLL